MISLILLAIAAVCNAICDIIKDLWDESIFSQEPFYDKNETNLNKRYWWTKWEYLNKYVGNLKSNPRKKFLGVNIHPAVLGGWHFFKMLMIVCVCFAIGINLDLTHLFNERWKNVLVDTFILGMAWNTPFSLFYNKLLKLKTWGK